MGYRLSVIGLLLSLVVTVSYALDIECIGTATQVVRGHDTTYVFRDEIALRSMHGDVDWFDASGQQVASNMDEIYPDPGVYTIRRNGKALSRPFRAKKYEDLPNLSFTVENTCGSTVLHVSGLDASARTYSLFYTALSWNGEAWTDSLVEIYDKKALLKPSITLPEPLYGATTITLCYDPEERETLGLDSACVSVYVPESDIKAVKTQLTAYATPHGAENEMKAYKAQMTLDARNSYSGPLEVAFYSNPTPAAQFYTWTIKKAEEVIVTRHDKDIRYTFSFSEPFPAGTSYTVECQVNNATCESEKEKIEVNISQSKLLVPNVFTPDNDPEHMNEEFRVAYQSIKSFHCEVYNRWGKRVFQWDDPSKGWDGTIYGKPAAEGAYFYIIHAVGTDDRVYKLTGDINLLRGKKK